MNVMDNINRLIMINFEAEVVTIGMIARFGNPKIGPSLKNLTLREHNISINQCN